MLSSLSGDNCLVFILINQDRRDQPEQG
jgi:hypothetical protein